jgi:membrane-bound lytic murein transglycosylase D
MRAGILFLATILAALGPGQRARSAEPADVDEHVARLFPRPAELEPAIAFWRAIFTQYSKHQVLLHDAVHLDKVYKVLDFRQHVEDGMNDGELAALERIETDLELDRLRATLLRLHALGPHPESLTAEERRVYDLYADDPAPDKFLAAADDKRLHSQRGLRERFEEGVRTSRRYFPEMERIFREEGLPVELTRLPLIESCFNLHAYSKVGAAGIWQFMPKTGRRFMRVDNLVDERRDPLSSTRAAAQFLTRVHDMLDSWPLAITAYNHGPDGVARAVDEVGTTDIARIVRDYHGKAFGFASRNFYVEFLAALEVERDANKHFGEMPSEPALKLRERRLDRALGIEAAARLAKTNRTELAGLNPALSSLVVSGRRPIPAGYHLHLPDSGSSGFDSRLAEFSAEERVTQSAAPLPEPRVTRVSATARRQPGVRHAVLTYRVRRASTVTRGARHRKVAARKTHKTTRVGKAGKPRLRQAAKSRAAESET